MGPPARRARRDRGVARPLQAANISEASSSRSSPSTIPRASEAQRELRQVEAKVSELSERRLATEDRLSRMRIRALDRGRRQRVHGLHRRRRHHVRPRARLCHHRRCRPRPGSPSRSGSRRPISTRSGAAASPACASPPSPRTATPSYPGTVSACLAGHLPYPADRRRLSTPAGPDRRRSRRPRRRSRPPGMPVEVFITTEERTALSYPGEALPQTMPTGSSRNAEAEPTRRGCLRASLQTGAARDHDSMVARAPYQARF